MNCRHCSAVIDPVEHLFVDLGSSPPSNAFVTAEQLADDEIFLPLQAFTCPTCRLVQIGEVQRPESLFSEDYVYFSSFSSSWLAHARRYVASVTERELISSRSFVVEVASNDGYLLQFVRERGIRCLGIEPTASTARAAREKGIHTLELFLGEQTGRRIAEAHGTADLVVANNVLAHVPAINDFVAGVRELLAPTGTVSFEFPHLLRLVAEAQFDTIYHEHYSYLSLGTVTRVLEAAGLVVWDAEELPTHGGSLRVWAQHAASHRPVLHSVRALLQREADAGMNTDAFYHGLQRRAQEIRHDLLRFLHEQAARGRTVVGYGAAAKGNTLLNFAGVGCELLPWVADASPHKQGRFLPGSHIPVVGPAQIRETRPDFILLLPWNLRDEVTQQLHEARDWGAKFVTAIPELVIS